MKLNNSNKSISFPIHNVQNLKKLGINTDNCDFIVALAGNPNTGKSTVFNYLTGLKQHTGNWPGKTVTRAEGSFEFNQKKFKIVDLPGTYSLLSTSTDEEVARNFILFGQPDVTVIVADSTRLERNLNLVLQILEITDRAILCLNLIDESNRNGIIINEKILSDELGIPVVPTIARSGKGIKDLLNKIYDVSTRKFICNPFKLKGISKELNDAIEQIVKLLTDEFPNLPNKRWVALRLLEGDQSIINSIRTGQLGTLVNLREEN